MTEIYWTCLIGGMLFSVLTFLLSDFFDHGIGGDTSAGVEHGEIALGDIFHPIIIVSAIMAFGGAGLITERVADVDAVSEGAIAAAVALVLSVGLYFLYVKPMRNRENSVSYSMAELPGRIGRISTPIPVGGYGEVQLSIAGSNVYQIAVSMDGIAIPEGCEVVVVDIQEHALCVVPVDNTHKLEAQMQDNNT